MDVKKIRVKRDQTTCSKFVNHSRLNNEHNLGETICPFNEHKNMFFENEQGIYTSGHALDLDSLTILY